MIMSCWEIIAKKNNRTLRNFLLLIKSYKNITVWCKNQHMNENEGTLRQKADKCTDTAQSIAF